LSKDKVSKLVDLYNDSGTKEQLKEKILDSPKLVNLMETKSIKKHNNVKKIETKLDTVFISAKKENDKARTLLENEDKNSLLSVKNEIIDLQNSITELQVAIAHHFQ
jgi:hypothetical protein